MKHFLNNIFSYYIRNNFHVAIAGASFTAISIYEVIGRVDYEYPIFTFFSTLLAYHFIRIFDECDLKYKSFRTRILSQTWDVLLILAIALLAIIYLVFKIPILKLVILVPAFFITFWYAIPLRLLAVKATSLRNHSKLKLFSVALVWSVVSVLFPLQEELFTTNTWLIFAQRLLIIMVLVLPFDIRDMRNDKEHLQTLPQQIGVDKTKKVGVLVLLVFLLLTFFKTPIQDAVLLADLFVFGLTSFLLLISKLKQSKYFASFWVESVPILWMLCIICT